MNILVFASRKGGAGKSTLAANFATYLAENELPTLLVDTDRQGSLELWHQVRGRKEPKIKAGMRDLAPTLQAAKKEGIEWVLIDTPPNALVGVEEAIGTASLVVIPMRPSLFDIAAVQDTIHLARKKQKPYAVVINAAPPRDGRKDHPAVKDARGALDALQVPTWHGQITHNPEIAISTAFGLGVAEYGLKSPAAAEMEQLHRSIVRALGAVDDVNRKHGRQREVA